MVSATLAIWISTVCPALAAAVDAAAGAGAADATAIGVVAVVADAGGVEVAEPAWGLLFAASSVLPHAAVDASAVRARKAIAV